MNMFPKRPPIFVEVMTLWLDKENLKQLADVLHAEGVYELMENKS